MGVCYVFETDKAVKAIERALEAGGAEALGTFSVDSTPFRPRTENSGISQMFLMHHSKFPQTSFTISPTTEGVKVKGRPFYEQLSHSISVTGLSDASEWLQNSPRAVCDRGIDLILAKLSAGLAADSMCRFEVNGTEYGLRDFVVRVGVATMGVTGKGVIVEVDYTPTWIPSQAQGMLNEFVQMFFPSEPISKPDSQLRTIPESYSSMDTANQYLRIFQAMRKRT